MAADMVRVAAEDRRQVATAINGREYRARDGYFRMTEADAAAHRRSGNLPASAAAEPVGRRGGYRCDGCGFGSFFVTCSRCGASCSRESS
jgi:hypothetical protein